MKVYFNKQYTEEELLSICPCSERIGTGEIYCLTHSYEIWIDKGYVAYVWIKIDRTLIRIEDDQIATLYGSDIDYVIKRMKTTYVDVLDHQKLKYLLLLL